METVARGKIFVGLAGWAVFAIQPVQADDQLFIHQKQQQQALEQRLEAKAPTVRLKRPDALLPDYPDNEHPCFTINALRL